MPIRFVDRVEGESKMSTFIVVEALGLVTWWGVQRLVGRLRRKAPARTWLSRRGRATRVGSSIVDDEPYITDVLSSALRFEGFETDGGPHRGRRPWPGPAGELPT